MNCAYSAELEKAKRLINEYCQEEFGNDAYFDNISDVGVAFTTTEKYGIPIQATVDLVHFELIRTFGNKVIERTKFDSLEELCNQVLANLDFSILTWVSEEEEEKYYREVLCK